MTQRKVVNGYECADGYFNVVISDGSTWWYDWRSDKKWKLGAPPLPPEALGDVAGEIKVGDTVMVAGYDGVGTVRAVTVDVEWPGRLGRGFFTPGSVTKVPR